MQFYRITGIVKNEKWEEESENRVEKLRRRRQLSAKSEVFNRDLLDQAFISLVDVENGYAQILAFVQHPNDPLGLVSDYLEAVEMFLEDMDLSEIGFKEAQKLLNSADRMDYIYDADDILDKFDLNNLDSYRNHLEWDETVLEAAGSEKVREAAQKAFARQTLLPEIRRVYKGAVTGAALGHPVHYLIKTDDADVRKAMYRPLFQALYEKKRIHSLRYVFTDVRPSDRISLRTLDRLYKSCSGGSVVIRYYANEETEGDRASADRELIETICECIKKHRHQVLTVLCLPRVCDKIKGLFYDYLGSVTLVEIQEDYASGGKAKAYLRSKVREAGTKADRNLYTHLKEEEAYLASDLNRIFDEWYNGKLKNRIYPQYKHMATAASSAVQTVSEGTAFEELQAMIGLGSAKKVMEEALAYYKAQRLFAEKGMKQDKAAMHMVFTGNPGTAKTTTARLFARIMRDNGLLSKGQLVEVGRSDLVGKFVGWTAPTVKKAFVQAKGGVLFIDEAYSLVDDRDGLYGDEAINTIVQEMENHREDMVVIFAGYPDKMQAFLDKNPGLRSRIAFHVPFEDYTAEDLCAITRLMADKKKIELTGEAMEKLAGIYGSALDQKDFGNGRYARNVLEKARMAQARRLLKLDPSQVTEQQVRTIEAADVELPQQEGAAPERRRIGF